MGVFQISIIITLIVALIGGFIALRLKVPAGAMIGSMLFVALLNLTTGLAFMPREVKIFTQIIAGLFIGTNIRRNDVLALRSMIKPAIITVFLILCFSLGMGMVLHKISGYDFVTAMFASAPGGIVDMTLISYDMGADTSVVSVLQLVRLISVISLFPPIIKWVITKFNLDKNIDKSHSKKNNETTTVKGSDDFNDWNKNTYCSMGITILVATISGLTGYALHIPAGTIMFSMIGVAMQNIFFNNAYMPMPVKKFAQVCAGTLIGEGITIAAVLSLRTAILPAIILLIGFIILTLTTGYILYKTSDLDIVTAFFACAPGGASDISLMAGDFGAETAKVTVIQLIRVVGVIAFYPMIIHLLTLVM